MTVLLLSAICAVRGAVYEAEDFSISAENAGILADASASGGKCVELRGPNLLDDPAKAAAAVRWKFTIDKRGLYDLRVRLFARNAGSDSLYVVLDKEKGQAVFSPHGQWNNWERRRVFLTAGEHVLTLKTRERGMRADCLEVVVSERYPKAVLNRFSAPPVYPVHGEHPRVLLRKQDLPEFKRRFEAYVAAHIRPDQQRPTIQVEAEIAFDEITPEFYNILRHMEPFGPGNPRPVFVTRNVINHRNTRRVGRTGEHLKLDLTDRTAAISGIAFGEGDKALYLQNGNPIDVCYELEENTFNHVTSIQLHPLEIRLKQL